MTYAWSHLVTDLRMESLIDDGRDVVASGV